MSKAVDPLRPIRLRGGSIRVYVWHAEGQHLTSICLVGPGGRSAKHLRLAYDLDRYPATSDEARSRAERIAAELREVLREPLKRRRRKP